MTSTEKELITLCEELAKYKYKYEMTDHYRDADRIEEIIEDIVFVVNQYHQGK